MLMRWMPGKGEGPIHKRCHCRVVAVPAVGSGSLLARCLRRPLFRPSLARVWMGLEVGDGWRREEEGERGEGFGEWIEEGG